MLPLLFIAVLAVAVIFSMLGLGGGVLYVPILLQAGISFHMAVATSLAIILIMSLTAAFVYHAEKLIDWKLILLLEPVSIIGAYLGSTNSTLFPEKALYAIFAVCMVGSAIGLFLPGKIVKKHSQKPKFPGIIHLEKDNEYYSINLWVGLPVSFAAGFISSILGIGGGFAKVPMMTLIFGVPIKVAVATSSAMIVITCLTGLVGHSMAGNVDWRMTAIMSAAVFIGAIIGSKISIKADKLFLNRAFAVLQVTIAVWMIYKAF